MRDFFYNKGDVLIAILIILVAAFVIYLRVGVIMDYSATGEKGGSLLPMPPAFGAESDSDSAVSGLPDEEWPDGEDPGQTGEAEPAPEPAPDPEPVMPTEEDPEEPVQEPVPEPPAPAPQEAQITVNAGDTGNAIAEKLAAAGLITDKQGWISDLMAAGADTKVKQGTFTIPVGASHADIIAILTK